MSEQPGLDTVSGSESVGDSMSGAEAVVAGGDSVVVGLAVVVDATVVGGVAAAVVAGAAVVVDAVVVVEVSAMVVGA